MGEYRSDPAVFAGYARARYNDGAWLLAVHVADSTGRCVTCSRPAPCPTAVTARRWCRDYAEWGLPETVGRGELVRPYVRTAVRGGHARP